MGPPIFIGGNTDTDVDALRKQVLQWGHRFSSVEIRVGEAGVARTTAASMGPPIFIGGNATWHNAKLIASICFNGATDFHRWKSSSSSCAPITIAVLQWGHRFSSVEMHAGGGSGDVPTPLQWGHRFSSVEIVHECNHANVGPLGFNGATDFHRWKLEQVASRQLLDFSFNGATDFHRWK